MISLVRLLHRGGSSILIVCASSQSGIKFLYGIYYEQSIYIYIDLSMVYVFRMVHYTAAGDILRRQPLYGDIWYTL